MAIKQGHRDRSFDNTESVSEVDAGDKGRKAGANPRLNFQEANPFRG